ncbi:MAG: DUF308 domain-containing protein [Massilibacteroides sp.]|nr:DUF308 domain-containing protein [Massilibacteroides sp.]MDD3063349.1 DUF308 domain-containing protein [Massilibacteroides sp.]MDD4114210.1 DUF308 domain-containing protein [Massilibacteroides sp.]MDD4661181.1 DUF308 domain-containing protein [Massilibacteroides sp.]
MKAINNLILQGLFSVILGLVLIIWPEQAIHYLMIAIGVFFLLPGIISLLNYLVSDKDARSAFPVEAIGSVLLGIVLLLFPTFFISIIMYLLGILAIIGGGSLIYRLLSARKNRPVSFWYYVLPVLILLVGVLILMNPEQVAANTFVIFGVVCILFGISLLINRNSFRRIQID